MRLALAIFVACATLVAVQGQNADPAPVCTDDVRLNDCKLPNCRCMGTDIPGNLPSDQTPQLVFLTFDDAVHSTNYPFYKEIFNSNRKNPNGHPITGTFYIAHDYTNYSMVHDLWRDGHEIALHSITHSPLTTYWRDLNATMWRQEVVDQREQMANLARIPAPEIKGLRAPFLQTGGDTMYEVLKGASFQYECSRPTLAFRKPAIWPYTNDYLSQQDCQIAPCPVGRYPAFWTVPMVDLIGDGGESCAMADTCLPVPETADTTFNLLLRNFLDHYEGNRAPFGVYIHHAWVNGTGDGDEIIERRKGYEQFIDHILTLNNTYIVSVTRGIEWIKTPQNIANTVNFAPFKVVAKPDLCPRATTCHYPPALTPFPNERYLHICTTCPQVYPWLGNHLGRG